MTTKSDLLDILRVLEEQERSLEADRLSLYVPHEGGPDGGQLAFHKSNKKIRLIISGNRFGKTLASVIEAIWLAAGLHPYHPIEVPNRGKLYADSFGMVMETLKRKFDEWLPMSLLSRKRPFVYNQMGMLVGINFACGSYLSIGSYDQETRKSEGSNWHFVSYDEPPPRGLYIANMRGLIDFGGLTWIAATPLSEPWIYDDLWLPGLNGEKDYIDCFRGTSDDNPTLDKKALELFLDELTEEEKDVRFYGNFAKLRGLVIDTYDPMLSDVESFPLNEQFVLFEGIDPHPNKPHVALWKAVDPSHTRYVVDELYCSGTIREFGEQLAAKRRELQKHGAVLVASVCDTSLNVKDPAFRTNLREELCDELRRQGEETLPYNAQKKDWLLPGIQRLRDLYRPVYEVSEEGEKISGVKRPKQFIFKDKVSRYRYELGRYQWPEGEKALQADVKPVKRFDEAIDCDRYIESRMNRIDQAYETPGSRFFLRQQGVNAYTRIKKGNRNGREISDTV